MRYGWIDGPEDASGTIRVGARDVIEDPSERYPYAGPTAHITHDESWVYVETDPHEGCAMLNIEALPYLIEALQRIQAVRSIPKRDVIDTGWD